MPAPPEHRYRPRGAMVTLMSRDVGRRGELLLGGPAGTGKSRGALEKVHRALLRYPRARALAVRQTMVSLTASALVTFENWVADAAIATGEVTWFGGSQRESPGYRYANGSFLAVGGMDKPDKIMSTEYDMAYWQEATEGTIEGWEKITSRLRNGRMPYQQMIADCNPSHPTHWLKLRCDSGTCTMLDTRHEDNPVYFDEIRGPGGLVEYKVTPAGAAYIAKLDALTGVRYLRLRKGLWVAAEGVIYDEFDPTVHLVDHFNPPANWSRYWGVDFGYVHPFVLQCWAVDGDGRMWLYREIFRTGRTVDEHARAILAIVAPGGRWIEPRPRLVVADHDAENRERFERELGMGTTPAVKTVTGGIEALQRRFRERRVFIMRGCRVDRDPALVDAVKPTCTEEELPAYVWDTGAGKVLKEAPLKVCDDGMDAMRYVAAELDIGRPTVRRM